MSDPSLESVFGENAGAVWRFLNSNGSSNIEGIVRATKLRRDLVFGALGWLGRENKIIMVKKGRAMVFSLREYEIQSEPVVSTTIRSCYAAKATNSSQIQSPKEDQESW